MSSLLKFTVAESLFLKKMIGNNLRVARNDHNLTHTQVMKEIWGITKSRSKICEIEAGTRSISVMELLAFQRLYGQSIDYWCGLSVEQDVDHTAGMVNHVTNRMGRLVESLTSEITSIVASQLKSICKNDTHALMSSAKMMCSHVMSGSNKAGNSFSPELIEAAKRTMFIINKISAEYERQDKEISMQITQIKERFDKEDSHIMQKDMKNTYHQYALPLPHKNINF